MRRLFQILMLLAGIAIVAGCGEKKKSDYIIATKPETPKPQGPIRMQEYSQTKDIKWLDKNYQIDIRREPDDSLRMVKDENGQKYVDNRISVRVLRADGSVFFGCSFTKAAFDAQLDNDYRRSGILESLVFDRVEGNQLYFAASVSLPQTDDEYIPMIVSVSNLGEVGIRRDNSLDTYGIGDEDEI